MRLIGMPKEKYDPPDPRRIYTIMSAEEVANGKKSHWAELEISGRVRSLSTSLWSLTHLTALHLNDNYLSRIPPDIAKLHNLVYLDLSSNKLRSLPAELGNMVSLRELLLNNNLLRVLPYELGRLFQLQTLGLKGNPLSQDILNLYQDPDGTRKLLNFMLDNLAVQFNGSVVYDSVTPETAASQASLSITNSRSLLKLTSIESVMLSNHLILCHPFCLLLSIFPSIRVFSNESAQLAPSLWETRPSAVDHCEVWEITLFLPPFPVPLQVYSSWLQDCLAHSVACMEDKNGRIVLDHIFSSCDKEFLLEENPPGVSVTENRESAKGVSGGIQAANWQPPVELSAQPHLLLGQKNTQNWSLNPSYDLCNGSVAVLRISQTMPLAPEIPLGVHMVYPFASSPVERISLWYFDDCGLDTYIMLYSPNANFLVEARWKNWLRLSWDKGVSLHFLDRFLDVVRIKLPTGFTLVQKHTVEFNQVAMANSDGSEAMLNRVMTKDNIGVAVVLEVHKELFGAGMKPIHAADKQLLIVANAHMHWDPEYSDVKLIQTMMFVSEVKNILEKASSRPGSPTADPNSIPLVLCADLNSLPDSGVVEYLSNGGVADNHKDFKELRYNECLMNFSCNGKNGSSEGRITHGFQLKSAYENNLMPYTNYTFDFKGVIDYIFYSKTHMA
ncbi:CCR4-NOT transcription complex subunit 6-like [Moschus berezovskii]|uniref:CCR4-NOT transcription complex subunit 6-like n=1 Tax=Moschus berezovskii TaxID=68408 RepID=UPI0024446459|nr:CCR4-NOT transcription complex subunit 6-like [Moschus berezovskii]